MLRFFRNGFGLMGMIVNKIESNYMWTNKNNVTYLIKKIIYATSDSVKIRSNFGLKYNLKGIFDPNRWMKRYF